MTDPLALLVLGGGPAGLSAAGAYRDAGGEGAVAIVSDESRMPYSRPLLSKELLRGEATEDELALEDEDWLAAHDVSLIAGRAMALDAGGREVTLAGGRRLTYATCLVATGAEPTRLPVPGADDPAVRVLRSLDDLRELQARLAATGDGEHDVIVIGSGFIGCEIAASLRRRNLAVTLISDEAAPNRRRLGARAGGELARWLSDEGVTLALGAGVEAIERRPDGMRVQAGDLSVTAAVVVMAAGVTPRGELAAAAGADLAGGAITVDSAMRSSLPGVLAAGDVCLADNAAAGRPLRVEHWGDALGQGAVAGATAAGRVSVWDAVPGFWSTIGSRTLKYAAWGDGYDAERFEPGAGESFAVWYGRDGRLAGVLTHDADDRYERGRELIAEGAPWG